MSELIVIGYPSEDEARHVLQRARAAERKELVNLDEVALVMVDRQGRLHLTTIDHLTERRIFGGIFWGILAGVLLVIPLTGVILGGAAVLGGTVGGLVGLVQDLGIKREFSEQVAGLIQPGTSALMLVVDKKHADDAISVLSHSGGTVLRTSLDPEAEEKLRAALAEAEAPVAA
jgi:uncharacterized membrane protein